MSTIPLASAVTPLASAVTPLAAVQGLEVRFRRRGRTVRALDGVDLEWRQNEVLGIVGESGCGKTTLARTLLGLEHPSAGELRFEGATLRPQRPAGTAPQGADDLPGSLAVNSTRACA